MNGDVGDVPLIWIESVFYHLKCIINDKKVLILSVLGIQSSGKSTLLNTMFGLQFSVSAGRCTRGLYMQLLKVDNHEDFDYLLVIDTEGIRAPELKDKRYDHDNELATYVIGIGDVILINIKGENTVELTDILGIVVQALMRLKNVNKTSHLKKRCIFVHQNVAASDASIKMLQQRQNLVDELNERTKEAAEQENVQDVHQFSDILHFDLDNDVMYFPDLWEGSPPMASINPDYSEQAGKVKDSVLYRPIPDRITYYTISETVTRMRDLWDGLLADDFVFSFRNNLELKAYMRIQSKFQEISFELETYINEIICNECSTDLQYELEVSDIDNVEKLLSTIETKMGRKANAKFLELQEKLENFFEKDEKKDIVIQWKQNKTIQLEELYNRLIPNAKKRLKLLAKETKFQLSQDQQLASFKKKANEMARKLACEFSGRCPEESIIQQRFSLAWNDIVAHFSTDETEDTVVSINSDIDGILSEKFRDRINQIEHFQKLIVLHPYRYRMQRLSGSLELQNIDSKKHLEICRSWKQTVSSLVKWNDRNEGGIHSMQIQALAITDSIFETIDGEIERFSSTANTKFDTTFVIKLLYIIRNDINEHNTQRVYPFKFTKSYESFLLTHTSSYLKRKLSDLNLRYNKKYSLKSKVERHKNKARTIFDMLVQSASMDSIALYCFEEVLSTAIIEHIMKQIPNRVAEVMLRKFHHSKYELIKDILISLANKQDSEDYFRYIHHPQAFAKSYLKTRTCEYFFHKSNETTKNRYFRFSEDQANIDFQTLSEVLYDLAHCTEGLTIPQFTEMLRRNLQAKIGITILSSSFSQVESNLQNSQTFIELIDAKRMESMKESVLAKFQVTSDDNVEWKQNPYDKMMDILWGCDAKCPFCYEPCMNAQKDHLKDTPHKCAVHRVKGVTGRYMDQTTDLAKTFCNISVCDSVDKFKHDNKFVCYKEYKTIYPEWDIAPNPETSKYWKWFCCEYKQSIEDKYTMQIEISDHWKTLSKVDAINSISLTSS